MLTRRASTLSRCLVMHRLRDLISIDLGSVANVTERRKTSSQKPVVKEEEPAVNEIPWPEHPLGFVSLGLCPIAYKSLGSI